MEEKQILIIPMGYGVVGVTATINPLTGEIFYFILPVKKQGVPGEYPEEFLHLKQEDGSYRFKYDNIPEGTIVIKFKDKKAVLSHIQLLEEILIGVNN